MVKRELTHARLLELVHYDPESGIFRAARNRFGGIRAGQVLGSDNGNGHLQAMIDFRKYLLHRLAWFYMTGAFPPGHLVVDHVNRVRSDNRWQNLRLATRSANSGNRLARGYRERDGFFEAILCGVPFGLFLTAEDAQTAYQRAHAAEFGPFSPYYRGRT